MCVFLSNACVHADTRQGATDLDTVLDGGDGVPQLPILYFSAPIKRDWDAETLHGDYLKLLQRSRDVAVSNNTLITPRHVVVVPRAAEDAEGISMNSLSYASVMYCCTTTIFC